jgi:TolB protein
LLKILVFLLFTTFGVFAKDSTIEVIKSVNQLPSIAIEDATEEKGSKDFSRKFYRLLINDFTVLTHFDVRDTNQKTSINSNEGEFANRDVNYVLKYKLFRDNQQHLSCRVKLLGSSSRVLFENSYKIIDELYPFLAHRIAGDVNLHFGMPKVDWLSRYIIFSRYTKPKHSEIVIADYTLTYMKTVVKHGLNLFPKWADRNQEGFYFTNYENGVPTLFKMNLQTGNLQKILETEGMLACSDVSEDGKKLLLTMAPKGQPDIFLYDVESRKRELLTTYSGIDVSANFIENGKRITFVSDRLGYPNIFAKDIDTKDGATEQLIYYGKNNNSCSAYKNYIVFSSRETENAFSSNTFNLHLISTNTKYVRRLTATGINQFPTFSSDGESILFIKHYKEQSSLGIIRLSRNKSFLFPITAKRSLGKTSETNVFYSAEEIGKIQSIDW